MSSSGSNSSAGSTDQRIQELLDQLQNLQNQLQNLVLPDNELVQAPLAVLQETRNRLRSLESEADDLRARIEQLLDTLDKEKAAAIRKLLHKP